MLPKLGTDIPHFSERHLRLHPARRVLPRRFGLALLRAGRRQRYGVLRVELVRILVLGAAFDGVDREVHGWGGGVCDEIVSASPLLDAGGRCDEDGAKY